MAFVVFLTALASASIGTPVCYETLRDVPADTALSAIDLTETACRSKSPRTPLRYDAKASVTITAAALPAGTYLGHLAPLSDRPIAKGAVLTLHSMAGPVVIEREVIAMQPGRSGHRIFVRDETGQVFSVLYVDRNGK